ncbi:MAG: SLBB domain-containing protein [Roseomonas sp.]|nr:SLBB domain-containing protein [Roseomonas sp.]MCA3328566.1 SLBB domain-containing protein [Roseomonas sp.]MCA3331557.1 SLBB domain-containing protein [Roseomonas sp.]MCA3336400.1 SLBB domain-containing protein [Roseomonas sp.]MCA3346190.1 SLBB domain-containing protein [Roseomonas sp.]
MPSFATRNACGQGAIKRLIILNLCLFLSTLPAAAQSAAQFLAPPSLPPSLPGGASLPSLPPGAQRDILARVLEAAAAPPPAALPAAATAPIAAPPAPRPALSSIEAFFAERLEQAELRQFGYETFRGGAAPAPSFGALPGSYILGPGDEVVVALRGRARQTLSVRIGRDGMLLLPELPPIPAAGRSLADLRADMEGRAARELGGSEVFLSIGAIRQISVFVGGEVMRPGFQTLTALASVLDALAAAEGVRRSGSLRAIRIEGPAGSRQVDLYPLLADAPGEADLTLREGERILVPPLGGVVAIAGDVARPGIYELPARQGAMPLEDALVLAGGPLRPSGNRLLVQQSDAQGRRSFAELAMTASLRRGDALLVRPGADVAANTIRLSGHVAMPITRAANGRQGLSVRALIADHRQLGPDPYTRFAVVLRPDQRSGQRHLLPFDLARALEGRGGPTLRDGDEVIVFSRADIQWLSSGAPQRALRGEATAMQGGECVALTQLAQAAQASPARFAHARATGFPEMGEARCPRIFQEVPELAGFLLDHAALVTGEVRAPGLYPMMDNTPLADALAIAGGVTALGNTNAPDVAQAVANPALAGQVTRVSLGGGAKLVSPRQALRIPRREDTLDSGPVLLLGEFRNPGSYELRRGERLSDAIARAGGLTAEAFPYGAVFTRESVRLRQQEGFARTARDLESSLVQLASGQALPGSRGGTADVGGAMKAGRELAATLREARAAGRVVVEANPVILLARPDLDILLEPGDVLAMPKRPQDVTVVGAVLNPGSLPFRQGWRAAEYIQASGGAQRFADASRVFVVMPNGEAAPAGQGFFQGGGPPLAPGSLVMLPQDPAPFETWGYIRDVTQILGQLTISSLALAVVAREARRD